MKSLKCQVAKIEGLKKYGLYQAFSAIYPLIILKINIDGN